MNTLSIPTLATCEFLILDLLNRIEHKDRRVSIRKPASTLDIWQFYGCPGARERFDAAAILLHAKRYVHGESRNGLIYVELPPSDYQGDEGDEQPRTIKQIACTSTAQDLEARRNYLREIEIAELERAMPADGDEA